jgi:hypothetical protein
MVVLLQYLAENECKIANLVVTPAKAGAQGRRSNLGPWIPAFATLSRE